MDPVDQLHQFQIFIWNGFRLIVTARPREYSTAHIGVSWVVYDLAEPCLFLRARSSDRALWIKNHFPWSADRFSPVKTVFQTPDPAPAPCRMQTLHCSARSAVSYHFTIRLLLIPYCRDNSDRVWSPFIAAKATFDLNSGEWFLRFLLIFCIPLFNKDNHTENNSLTSTTCCPTTGVHFSPKETQTPP